MRLEPDEAIETLARRVSRRYAEYLMSLIDIPFACGVFSDEKYSRMSITEAVDELTTDLAAFILGHQIHGRLVREDIEIALASHPADGIARLYRTACRLTEAQFNREAQEGTTGAD